MKKRLKHFILEVLKITITDFASEVGTARTYLSQIMREDDSRELGLELAIKIKKRYPYLNLNWLLTGQGEIWLDKTIASMPAESSKCTECDKKDNLITTLQRALEQSLNANEILKSKLQNLDLPGKIEMEK